MSLNMTVCPVCEDTFTYTPAGEGCCGLGCAEKFDLVITIAKDLILGNSEHLERTLKKARKNKPKYHRALGGITLYPLSHFVKEYPKASYFGKAAIRISKAALDQLILEAKGLSEWNAYLEALEEAEAYYSRDNPATPSE